MALSVAITITVLYPPLAVFCAYLIYQARFLSSRVLIIVLTAMMLTNNLLYPLSRIFFYLGYSFKNDSYYLVSAILTGFSQSIASMVIWIFAGKMWAVGWHLKLIKQNRDPKTDDRCLNFIYYLILGINFGSGLFVIYQ